MSDSSSINTDVDESRDSPKASDVPSLDVHDDRHREAYRLRRRGRKVIEIADQFGVDVRTIYRWIQSYHETCRRTLEETPVVNLIAEELAKLEEVEQTALRSADSAIQDAHRRAYLNLALKAMQTRHHLLLEVGVLPREPTKIYSAVHEMKPQAMESPRPSDDGRTDDEIRRDVVKLLRQSRSI